MTTSSNDFLPPSSLTIAILTYLRDTSPTPSQDTLIVELHKLELVLLRTKLLDQSVHCTQVATLKEVVIQCRDAIIELWERKILKGDGGLGENDWRMLGSWQDINWDACDEGDLANLEADLIRYKERVERLMASMGNSERQLAGPTTQSATAEILLLSQEELASGFEARGVKGELADLPIEDSQDPKLKWPEKEVSGGDSTAQEHQDGAQPPSNGPSTMYTF
jgi:hypothetical protein